MYSPYSINKSGSKTNITGTGHLLIAKDINRTEFVEMCYRTSSVMMTTAHGEYYERVKVADGVMNYLKFPEENDKLGSSLIWIKDTLSGFPMVIGVLLKADQINSLQEHEASWGKKYKENLISLSGNVQVGTLLLSVNAEGNGYLLINSDNLLSLLSNGDINIEANKIQNNVSSEINTKIKKLGEDAETNASYKLGKGYNYQDEFENEIEINSDHIKFRGKKFVQEVDGYSIKELMQDFQSALQNLQIATALGNQAPLNMTEIIELTNKINQIYE